MSYHDQRLALTERAGWTHEKRAVMGDVEDCAAGDRVTTHLTTVVAASPHPVRRADVHPLTLDFLVWLATRPRSYDETMEAWRTSCPRLSIWEDALADGLIAVQRSQQMAGGCVVVTKRGRALLDCG